MKEDVVALQKKKLVRAYTNVLLEKGAKTPFYRESPCLACLQTFIKLFQTLFCLSPSVDIC